MTSTLAPGFWPSQFPSTNATAGKPAKEIDTNPREGGMHSEDAVIGFAIDLFKSVWALELLLALKRDPASEPGGPPSFKIGLGGSTFSKQP